MRSRRNRKYRKIEVVDKKVNLVNLKVEKWVRFYDKDMNSVAKGMIVSVSLGIIALIISISVMIRGVIQ